MHDGMQYDLIQGQGHKPFKVGNLAIFRSCLLRHLQWELATYGSWCIFIYYKAESGCVGFMHCFMFLF